MFVAGSIATKLGLDFSEFASGMLQAQAIGRVFPSFVQSFMANPLLGLVDAAQQAAKAIQGVFAQAAGRADDLGKAAQKAGVSVEFFSTVGKAAEMGGSSMEGFGQALTYLNRNTAEALAGNKEIAASFQGIGVGVSDLASMSPEDLFMRVADGIAAIQSPAERTRVVMDLLGRGGSDMLAFLQGGSAGISEVANEVAAFGGGVSTQTSEMAEKVNDMFALFQSGWDGIKLAFAEPLLAAFGGDAEAMKETVNELVQSLAALARVLGTLVANALKVVMALLKPVIDAFNTLAGAVGLGGSAPGSGGGANWRGVGASGAGAGVSGGGTVIQNLNVAGIDGDSATTQIAAKLRDPLRRSLQRQREELESAAAADRVRDGL